MHICLLTPSFPPMVDGGVAIATGRLVQCLLQRGHRITVVTTVPPEKAGGSTSILPEVCQPGMALHDGLVEDPLHAVPAVEALRVWAQARHQREPFDVILLDPPYAEAPDEVIAAAGARLAAGGVLVLEHARRQLDGAQRP